jgi:hypothetical protein
MRERTPDEVRGSKMRKKPPPEEKTPDEGKHS